jgi:hypothetical protein
MLFQVFGDGLGILDVPFHAQTEGLQPLHEQPRFERAPLK